MPLYIIIAIGLWALWNIITFAMYGIDKRKAKKNKWRISEATLIACAFLMGGVGALLGMNVFRHKTQHLKFKLLVPLAVLVNIGLVVGVAYLCYTGGWIS
ncbi:MAG: DUF1294 domain-containing protein [Defluviitaleaceae bacterium]|nr:DUF1294 domain-containing protein [Defluviitaleaceae bacterium]